MTGYSDFLKSKTRAQDMAGFEPLWIPDWMFDFQEFLTRWSIRQGRAAVFADCGLGKSPMQLVVAENMVKKYNKPALIVAPLAVSRQFVSEGEKFGIEVHRTQDGKLRKGINVTNYERLGKFDPSKLCFVSGDESGCIKHFDTATRKEVTGFMSEVPCGFLGTATPAPNDYMELGSSSEALRIMNRNRMLSTFFTHCGDDTSQWVLKGHAKVAFWRWVASWARAIRKPSDFGFDDSNFILPPMSIESYVVPSGRKYPGFFPDAVGMDEQRAEKRASIASRCEKVAELVPGNRPTVIWCHLNPEGDLLEKIVPDAVQVSGSQPDEVKEERLAAFSAGEIRVLVTKAKIGGWGLNWQHCSDVFCFASHSYEAFYQTVRRCWRFGQKRHVSVRLVHTDAEGSVVANMMKKDRKLSEMFDGIIREMNRFQREDVQEKQAEDMELPSWL